VASIFLQRIIYRPEGGIFAFTWKVRVPQQKDQIISTGDEHKTSVSLELNLDIFYTRLKGLIDTCALGYLLREHRKEFGRLHLRRKLEREV